MSLDLRMIDENGYSDHIDNKASHCAKMLNDYYQKYDAQKGTQFVFSDLGTYKPRRRLQYLFGNQAKVGGGLSYSVL